MVVYTYISVLRKWRQEDLEFEVSPSKVIDTLSQKENTNKRV
jgi:hypothetical protein